MSSSPSPAVGTSCSAASAPTERSSAASRAVAGGRAEVFPSEGSGRVSGLSWAEGLVALDDGPRAIEPGDPVRFLPFSSLD